MTTTGTSRPQRAADKGKPARAAAAHAVLLGLAGAGSVLALAPWGTAATLSLMLD